MHIDWSSLFAGIISGIPLIKLIELGWDRWIQKSDRVSQKKDAIGQEFNRIYFEGKKYKFRRPPKDEDTFNMVIHDIEKYDRLLALNLKRCKFLWEVSGRRTQAKYKFSGLIDEATFEKLTTRIEYFEESRAKAESLAYEVHEVIKKKWII
jgi:hypothetical protein